MYINYKVEKSLRLYIKHTWWYNKNIEIVEIVSAPKFAIHHFCHSTKAGNWLKFIIKTAKHLFAHIPVNFAQNFANLIYFSNINKFSKTFKQWSIGIDNQLAFNTFNMQILSSRLHRLHKLHVVECFAGRNSTYSWQRWPNSLKNLLSKT